MRINSVYISAFGGIKNLKLDFNEGFNIIYGDNEQGKTTVMSFIKIMFYGSERGSSQLSKNIRKKYTPWDGSPMAGSIDFEHSGKKYRLEKEFRSSNSTDKATLCDLDFGTRQAVTSDVGTKFFGLSAPAFERSVFIGQFGFPESDNSAEGEINSKLSNIALTGEESVSFDAVNERLLKAKLSLMSKSGRAGEYDKNVKLCAELKGRIEKAISIQNEFANKKALISAKEQEIAQMLKTAKELKVSIDSEQDIRNSQKMTEYLTLKAQLDEVNQTLKLADGGYADEMYLSKVKFCIAKATEAEQKTEAKAAEIKTLKKSIEAGLNPPKDANPETAQRIKSAISALENKKQQNLNSQTQLKADTDKIKSNPQNKKNPKIVIFIAGLICLAAAIGLFVAKQYIPFGITATVSAVLIAIYNVLTAAGKTSERKADEAAEIINAQITALETENQSIDREIFDKKVRLEAITAALNSSAAVIENQQKMLAEAENELNNLETEKQTQYKTLTELYSRFKSTEGIDEIITSVEEIAQKTAKQKEIKQQLNFISKDLGGISYEEAKQKLDQMGEISTQSNVDFADLKERYEQLISAMSERKSQIATLSAEIKTGVTQAENPEELKKQLKETAEKALSQKEFCDAADIAMQVLTESFGEVRRSYGSVLEKNAAEIFGGITGGKYDSMSISKSFEINVGEKDVFGGHEIDYLSSGTADQAYLALRLAVSRLICQESESLPLFLDDALAQYDDNRMALAIDFLKEYSKEHQIVMFTCHNSIASLAESKDANKIEIK